MGFHCSDCVYASFAFHEESGLYQGSCSRGYTLANPHVSTSPENYFAASPRELVPTVDPFGEEYLRTSNVCERFIRPQDLPDATHHAHHLFHFGHHGAHEGGADGEKDAHRAHHA